MLAMHDEAWLHIVPYDDAGAPVPAPISREGHGIASPPGIHPTPPGPLGIAPQGWGAAPPAPPAQGWGAATPLAPAHGMGALQVLGPPGGAPRTFR